MVKTQIANRGVRDAAVLAAMNNVPRHWFVPEAHRDQAYADRALPIGAGQTISQPYIVAKMTELLRLTPGDRVLEIGTGSGYQAAVLAQMGAEVISIEMHADLAASAETTLARLYERGQIRIIIGDGTRGCPDFGPYDRIIVTAGGPHLPQALQDQLADTGCCVAPIGSRDTQQLIVIERNGDEWCRSGDIGCRFVPLIGKDGWPE